MHVRDERALRIGNVPLAVVFPVNERTLYCQSDQLRREDDCKHVAHVLYCPGSDMSAICTEGLGNIPEHPTLVMLNRADLTVMQELEKLFGSSQQVAWLVDETMPIEESMMQHLQQKRAPGILYKPDSRGTERILAQIESFLAHHYHVILLPGKPTQLRASLSDVPASLLTIADAGKLPVLPVYVGMYNDSTDDAISAEDEYDELHIHIMPLQKPGVSLGVRVLTSWMEASADALMHHPQFEHASLAHSLLCSLKEYPEVCLLDGIDNSVLPYKDLLALSIMLANNLRQYASQRRIGIILPPGKASAIANVACILAGLVPVNINYNVSAEVFQAAAAKARIDRYLTDERFVSKMNHFAWPPSRDLIFVERELAEVGAGRLRFWKWMVRFCSVDRLAALLHLPEKPNPDAEAALLFTGGASGPAKAVPMTHRMLMANLMQTQSRIDMQPGDTVLSALPMFQSYGLHMGFLFPLLFGYNMVTYPDPFAARRLCELMSENEVNLAVATPVLVRRMLQMADEETFDSVEYFIVGSEKLPADLAAEAERRFKLTLLECYGLAEASPLVALNLPNPVIKRSNEPFVPANKRGTVGVPLQGIAVRITDPAREGYVQSPGASGLIWLKGPSIMLAYLGDDAATAERVRGAWFCTGDIGRMDADGMLTIGGRRSRFSKIGGEMVPHDLLEQVVNRVLKVNPADPERKICVVGVPSRTAGEQLVLLSILHKTTHPHDLITLRYGIMGEGYPALWCPERIIPIPAIPELQKGKVDFIACRKFACEALGIQPDS